MKRGISCDNKGVRLTGVLFNGGLTKQKILQGNSEISFRMKTQKQMMVVKIILNAYRKEKRGLDRCEFRDEATVLDNLEPIMHANYFANITLCSHFPSMVLQPLDLRSGSSLILYNALLISTSILRSFSRRYFFLGNCS